MTCLLGYVFIPFFHTVSNTCLFSLWCYILRINFCLFHFAVIQGEEWNGVYSEEIEEGKGLAELCASYVKISILTVYRQWYPFKGPLKYKMSLQRHANYFCTFQLSGMKLLPRGLGGVLFHTSVFLFPHMSPVADF